MGPAVAHGVLAMAKTGAAENPMAITLLYHDVTPPGRDDSSGFGGAGATHYKLTEAAFTAHLEAIARTVRGRLLRADELAGRPAAGLLLTFDDGGSSAWAPTADLLEMHG